ncbi:MAG: Glucose starvation-inducible protein B [Candidatus Daviesbacteria bacterium GW2011_GWA2_38_24]|uniref:Glucose starvation-inducible protein B n=1 Tax=Candidatus Daviesbacteria bacterium GW2011_GWA2_38_24 TaxID=1618422 RepID=A0A0G0JV84_9BACT|nr:MAG: Glucose starvation-inducible protein B [Candidatus Daviesbacteria bacterium GW2011_GWA2_38_24]KKQ80760.1 MAG: Glucose starvation-inducible protein B [Candidatus Daviesbacteria bacterium GW2011_GWA1_38_7]OGE22746.1 MAG: hypothetical protein A2688_01380 [Candidatus Daviesbacteria bacterium RIFCSPHIGHO2_01_FULL_38_8]
MAQKSDNKFKKKGRGWHGDPGGHAEAGRAGGKKTASTHDESFYSQIGRKGGQKSPGNFKNDPERAREAGRRGGQKRSNRYARRVMDVEE